MFDEYSTAGLLNGELPEETHSQIGRLSKKRKAALNTALRLRIEGKLSLSEFHFIANGLVPEGVRTAELLRAYRMIKALEL